MSAPESLCECGHECRAHPNVGRIASWPTRCLYCECLEFKPREGWRAWGFADARDPMGLFDDAEPLAAGVSGAD